MKDYSKYLAIPYRERGRDFNGCDCWGLVRLFLKNEFGIELDSYTEYSVANIEEVKQVAEIEKGNWVRVEAPEPGDVVEIQILKRDYHVGVIPHPGYVLHVCNERFSEMNLLTHPLLKRNVKGFWRHKG